MRQLAQNKTQALIGLLLILTYGAYGAFMGLVPEAARAATFGEVMRVYGTSFASRAIFVALIIDAIVGMIGAVRVGVFNSASVANFMRTSVIGYAFGFLIFWLLAYWALGDVVPQWLSLGVIALGFGAVITALTMSIVDNLIKLAYGSTPPHDAINPDQTVHDPQG